MDAYGLTVEEMNTLPVFRTIVNYESYAVVDRVNGATSHNLYSVRHAVLLAHKLQREWPDLEYVEEPPDEEDEDYEFWGAIPGPYGEEYGTFGQL